MKGLSKDSASWHAIPAEYAGQRLDNYLTRLLKGVPKSHIYRIVRNGEIRVNSGRVAADYRLEAGDRLRVPPVRVAERGARRGELRRFEPRLLHEDEALLVLDKPAGVAVHGGSGVSLGVIEQLRALRPELRFLELVHRLDRDTSGVLLLAKKRSALLDLHRQLREGAVRKFYLALVRGRWTQRKRSVALPLSKRVLASGERRVGVDEREGQPALTVFRLVRAAAPHSLVEAELKTGRTHQIRVHLAHLGHPILGDDKYGDFALNKALAKQGLKRLFLHASRTVIAHPASGRERVFESALPQELEAFLQRLREQARRAPAL
jgi:23S rRNA pseudouridine955/2504/2580 synthase